ncbi:MAG TPA: ankyrin repeat domain-containing protein, partial [Verrucomicrobiae bacterium]|nr:ankyrin repeat domain-containing protein [Verrucomicrobiae bacterium]
ARVDAFDKHGVTPLHLAARVGHVNIVALFLDNRADINRRNYPGRTALIMASVSGQLPVVEQLLERRADVNGRDYSNKTALYYAAINEHEDIAALLKKFGAKD